MSTISNESIMSDLSSITSHEEIKDKPIPLEICRNKIDSGKRSIQKEKKYVRSVVVKKILQELDTVTSNQENGSTGSSTRKNSDNHRQEQEQVLQNNFKRQNYSCLSSHGSSTQFNDEENQFYWNRTSTKKRIFFPTKKYTRSCLQVVQAKIQ